MDEQDRQRPATAVWYFVGATFLFSGGVFGQTLLETSPWLSIVSFVLGAVVFVIGAVVFTRELRAKDR